jgi:ubiquinone/menaquinone biosynthesis C-methylase UbiE
MSTCVLTSRFSLLGSCSGSGSGSLLYYDERAPEYEDAYILGTGTASNPDPKVFRTEATQLADVARRFARGHLIDLACGTAYWLPHYVASCSAVTLFDQSARMLDEARKKIARLGVADRCSVIGGDVFDCELGQDKFDCALVGFLLSHVPEAQEQVVFELLQRTLTPAGRFLIFDSAYSSERARFNDKVERQERRLNDGSAFQVYKRYFDRRDIASWVTKYSVVISLDYFGAAFFAVSGSFRTPNPDLRT